MKWIKVKLTDICKPKQWKNLPISEMVGEGFPVYGANGIIGKYREYNHEFSTLAITCRGATCGTINITEPKSYITSNAMALDEISETVNPKFLYYALKKRGFKDIITGAAQPQITGEGLNKIVLNIPERLDDQIQIANLLSKAETLIEQRKLSIALLNKFLKSTFSEMFGNPITNIKQFRKEKLKQFIVFLTSGGRGWNQYYSNKGKRFIRSFDVQMNGISNEDAVYVNPPNNQESKRTEVKPNDILLTVTGSKIGRVTTVPIDFGIGYVSQHVAIIRVKNIMPLYLSYYLSDINCGQYLIRKNQYGQTKPGLNFKQIEGFEILIPPPELQTQFAQIVTKTEALKKQYKNSLQELENLYGSLSQQAFSGTLTFLKTNSVDAYTSNEATSLAAEPIAEYKPQIK
jgi:type I restriction enzyme S subunit